MKIYPSILEINIEIFWQQIKKLSRYFSYFQIDITDGRFVPNKTIQVNDIISMIKQSSGKTIMNIFCEFHLMVKDYLSEIEKLKKLSDFMEIEKVLIHLKAYKNPNYQLPITNYQYGLVLNPEDDVKSNWLTIKNFPTVQIMSINPGFQGTPLLPKTLNKINELRNLGYKGITSLDGAINDKTLPIILKNKHKPDILFPGSYLKEKTEERLKILNRIIINYS
jgi:pentose-5-phosphate-3-epimerase